ncbi:MAG: hypothetical protein FWF06_07395, partial [Symbiobacteriaceae bacterium]|nr:hypothetical protein [Symbiobacteriaceae bacterium]
GNLEPLIITEFPISEIGLRRDGRGSYFTREISLAQHELNYTSGAEVIEASWWDAKLTWTNYSSLWDARVTNLMLTHWEPVSEKRLAYFLQTPYHSETVSFIYDANHTTPAGE